eukprot:TRINITY_DN6814_c0_g1_i1.p1 TRINITY_DN6814_c0_g1~~TRINITY_DN6814_c0_g1_i1.p1  ORF type:complete len:439 (-),score=59.50 TRINITY_DN6814_c0_g1_i1:10-1326(-)
MGNLELVVQNLVTPSNLACSCALNKSRAPPVFQLSRYFLKRKKQPVMHSSNVIKQSHPDIQFESVDVPVDEEDPRFVQSFAVGEAKEILKFFEEYGFVVVKDILTPLECEATIDEAFHTLSTNSGGAFQRDDPSTWDQWPSTGMSKYGQISRAPVFTPQAMMNRQNPRLHEAFSLFWNRGNPEVEIPDLLVSHDRLCIYRPTKDVLFPDGSIRNLARYKIPYNIHLDINPTQHAAEDATVIKERWEALKYGQRTNHFITENNIGHHTYHCLQGVLNLADNLEEDGGFVCVPGWTKHYATWLEKNTDYLASIDTPSVQFDSSHWLNKYARRISMRAGSIVIFDSRTAHGAGPNNSSHIRCAQFIKMFAVTEFNSCILQARKATIEQQMRINNFLPHLTPLGRTVFGLDLTHKTPARQGLGRGSAQGGQRGRGRIQGQGW